MKAANNWALILKWETTRWAEELESTKDTRTETGTHKMCLLVLGTALLYFKSIINVKDDQIDVNTSNIIHMKGYQMKGDKMMKTTSYMIQMTVSVTKCQYKLSVNFYMHVNSEIIVLAMSDEICCNEGY